MAYNTFTYNTTLAGAIDRISGADYPRVKISWGPAGTANEVDTATPLPVDLGANNDVTVTGTVTANLSATDNAVLDAIAASVAGTLTVGSHAVTNAGTFAAQIDGAALTALQLIDDAVYVDDADWTDSTSKHLLTGGLYQSSPQTITSGDVGPFQVTANGYLIIKDIDSADVSATDGAANPTERLALGAENGSNIQGLHSDGASALRVRTGANIIDLEATVTRPADTPGAYSDGDLVANDTVAGNVNPMSWALGRNNNDGIAITGARMNKTAAGTTGAIFWLHLFTADPTATAPTNGDHDPFELVTVDPDEYIGSIKFDYTDTDCPDIYAAAHICNGEWLQGRQDILFKTASATATIYGLLQAKGAYTPASAEVFGVFLEAVQA